MLLVPLLLVGLVVLALGLVRLAGRPWLERTILETDTPSGKVFDAMLMLAIALSVLAVVLEVGGGGGGGTAAHAARAQHPPAHA
jgi:voltage-gated potassium channel